MIKSIPYFDNFTKWTILVVNTFRASLGFYSKEIDVELMTTEDSSLAASRQRRSYVRPCAPARVVAV